MTPHETELVNRVLLGLADKGFIVVPVRDLLDVVEVADRNEFHPSISRIKSVIRAILAAAQEQNDASK